MWIKQVGCECEECGPDPCTDACICNFYRELEPNVDETLDVTGLFIVEHEISIELLGGDCHLLGGGDGPRYQRIQVYGNSSLIYDSGCISGGISTTIFIPAGTTSLNLINTYDCTSICESDGPNSAVATFDCV